MVPIANDPRTLLASHSASGVVDAADALTSTSPPSDLVSTRSPDALSDREGNQLGKITIYPLDPKLGWVESTHQAGAMPRAGLVTDVDSLRVLEETANPTQHLRGGVAVAQVLRPGLKPACRTMPALMPLGRPGARWR